MGYRRRYGNTEPDIGCLLQLLWGLVGLPALMLLFINSPGITGTLMVIAILAAIYTRKYWLSLFEPPKPIFYDLWNGDTETTQELRPRAEVEVITRMLLSNPDLDCKPTKGNGITLEESVQIHFNRLKKYGHSRRGGEIEYMGPRGGIYTYTAGGNKNYR